MHPPVSAFQALFAAPGMRFHFSNLIRVRAFFHGASTVSLFRRCTNLVGRGNWYSAKFWLILWAGVPSQNMALRLWSSESAP